MKAEKRKELHTNELADRMGRLVQTVKSGSKSTSILIGGLVLVALGTLAAWRYYANESYTTRSALWTRLESAGTGLPELDQLAKAQPETMPSRVARVQLARVRLQRGLQNLYAELDTERAVAVENVEKARALYEQLARECSDVPLLAQEALMGEAKGEEALAGVPKADNPQEGRGDLNRAMELYQKLAAAYPDSFQGQAAVRRAQELREKREPIQALYGELARQAVRRKS